MSNPTISITGIITPREFKALEAGHTIAMTFELPNKETLELNLLFAHTPGDAMSLIQSIAEQNGGTYNEKTGMATFDKPSGVGVPPAFPLPGAQPPIHPTPQALDEAKAEIAVLEKTCANTLRGIHKAKSILKPEAPSDLPSAQPPTRFPRFPWFRKHSAKR